MIGKGRTGSSFGGLQGYLLNGKARDRDAAGLQEYLLDGKIGRDRVEWTSTRNLPTEDPRYAAAVMRATAEQNPRVQKPVYHLSLSAAPGEQISKEQWERIADRVLNRLGLDDRQALVVAHNDTRHPHIHLMVNRVHPEHLKAWHNGHDHRRIEKALRHIERDFKLREVPGHHYQLAGQQAPERARTTDGERRQAERTGEPAWADRIRFKIYDDLKQAKSWGDLERRLAGHRLRLERRGGGLVITDGKNQVKASRVYRRASYRWLEQRFGMKFEAWRSGRRELVEAVARYQEVERRREQLERERDAAWRSLRKAERHGRRAPATPRRLPSGRCRLQPRPPPDLPARGRPGGAATLPRRGAPPWLEGGRPALAAAAAKLRPPTLGVGSHAHRAVPSTGAGIGAPAPGVHRCGHGGPASGEGAGGAFRLRCPRRGVEGARSPATGRPPARRAADVQTSAPEDRRAGDGPGGQQREPGRWRRPSSRGRWGGGWRCRAAQSSMLRNARTARRMTSDFEQRSLMAASASARDSSSCK